MVTGGARRVGLDRYCPGSGLAGRRSHASARGAGSDFPHQQHVVEHDVPRGIIVEQLQLQRLAGNLGQRVDDQCAVPRPTRVA